MIELTRQQVNKYIDLVCTDTNHELYDDCCISKIGDIPDILINGMTIKKMTIIHRVVNMANRLKSRVDNGVHLSPHTAERIYKLLQDVLKLMCKEEEYDPNG